MPPLLSILLSLALAPILALGALSASAQEVRLVNKSQPSTCAEVDNVDVRLMGPSRLAFTVEAMHPLYLEGASDGGPETGTADGPAPHLGDCEFVDTPAVHQAEPARLTLFEDAAWRITAERYASFWRPADVPVLIGDERFEGLHLVQVERKAEDGSATEVLGLYPPDGSWRAKPLPPAGRERTAFGSTFLIGPVEDRLRPIVALDEVRLDPAGPRFELRFADGGSGALTLEELDETALRLDVALEGRSEAVAFAAVRSMYVAPELAETSTLRLQRLERDARERGVMNVDEAVVDVVTFLRDVPSAHKASAPDLRLGPFRPLAGG